MKRSALVFFALGLATLLLALWYFARTREQVSSGPLVVFCPAILQAEIAARCERIPRESFPQGFTLTAAEPAALLTRLRERARVDLLVLTDSRALSNARAEGLVSESATLFTQTPVVAIPHGNPKVLQVFDDLLRSNFRLGIAPPESGWLGQVTRAAAGVRWELVGAKATLTRPSAEELIKAVQTGEADAAIVWDTSLANILNLQALHLPQLEAQKQEVTIALVTSSAQPTRARECLRQLTSTKAFPATH